MHIQDREQCNWLRSKVELSPSLYIPSKEERIECLDKLTWATRLEEFLALKFPDKRSVGLWTRNLSARFGIDGGEAIIPGISAFVETAATLGVKGIFHQSGCD